MPLDQDKEQKRLERNKQARDRQRNKLASMTDEERKAYYKEQYLKRIETTKKPEVSCGDLRTGPGIKTNLLHNTSGSGWQTKSTLYDQRLKATKETVVKIDHKSLSHIKIGGEWCALWGGEIIGKYAIEEDAIKAHNSYKQLMSF